ncbi:MAG: pyridoxal-phosphate dependent enzyme [Candidatus Acidiferrales bacterium]
MRQSSLSMIGDSIRFEEVQRARELLRGVVPASRLVEAASLARVSGADVRLKLECEGPTGSFKVRGATVAIRRRIEQGGTRGVVTSSTGNHGAAVAFAARQGDLPAAVFLPEKPNPVKRERIARLGAQIFEAGRDIEESRERASQFARERGWALMTDGVDPEIVVGTATIGCEIIEQYPDIDTIYVLVGDSSLIRGIAFAAKELRPQVSVIGVQAEGAPAYARSWREQHAIMTKRAATCADGLGTRMALEQNVRELCKLVNDMALVSDEEMLRALPVDCR